MNKWYLFSLILLLCSSPLLPAAATSRIAKNLFQACALNALDEIERLTKAGADIDIQDRQGDTPLLYAIICNYTPCAQKLISLGADLHKENSRNCDPLTLAINYHNKTILKDILDKGIDPNEIKQRGNCANSSALDFALLHYFYDIMCTVRSYVTPETASIYEPRKCPSSTEIDKMPDRQEQLSCILLLLNKEATSAYNLSEYKSQLHSLLHSIHLDDFIYATLETVNNCTDDEKPITSFDIVWGHLPVSMKFLFCGIYKLDLYDYLSLDEVTALIKDVYWRLDIPDSFDAQYCNTPLYKTAKSFEPQKVKKMRTQKYDGEEDEPTVSEDRAIGGQSNTQFSTDGVEDHK